MSKLTDTEIHAIISESLAYSDGSFGGDMTARINAVNDIYTRYGIERHFALHAFAAVRHARLMDRAPQLRGEYGDLRCRPTGYAA